MPDTQIIKTRSVMGQDLEHLYFRHGRKQCSETLTVVCPGAYYTAEMPMLYFARAVALQWGSDTLNVRYCPVALPKAGDEAGAERLVVDARRAVEACMDQQGYRRLLFVGKSLGTLIAGRVGEIVAKPGTKYLFLTPVSATLPHIRKQTCCVICGLQDPYFTGVDIEVAKSSPGAQVHVLNGVGHRLEVEDSFRASLRVVELAMAEWEAFAFDPSARRK